MPRLLLALVFALIASVSSAENRFGLVIGNDSYQSVPALAKARADARAVSTALDSQGFHITTVLDAPRRDMNRQISKFTSQLQPGDTAFVFFAGHGVEIDGENYLLPTDIIAPSSGEKDFIKSESISLSQLLDRVRATGARTTVAVIDACRNNPFATPEGRSIGTTRGLGRITAPQGSFVIFSAGAGQLALDELGPSDPGRNSVFTRMLLPRLSDPELELRALMSEVRSDVRELALTVNHQQFPAYYDELLGDFYFARTVPSPTEAATVVPEPADPPQSRMATPPADPMRQDFKLARSIGTEGALRAFLNRYSDRSGDFTYQLAAQMLDQMQPAPATAPKPHTAQPDLSRRDIIRQTQQGLTARGCNAGTADGVIGNRTRRAFADFLAQSGADLTPASLGTQAALTAVIATTGTICQPTATSVPVAEAAPAATGPTLAGSWSFTANCPLFITTTGTVRLRDAGQGRYIGTMSDSLGQTAQLNLQLNGLAFTATEIYPHTTIAGRGRLSADGQSYTSATAAGCKVQARKR